MLLPNEQKFAVQLLDALGMTDAGVQRIVLVVDCDEPVKVYYRTLLQQANADRVIGCIKTQAVANVEVGDDCIMTMTPIGTGGG